LRVVLAAELSIRTGKVVEPKTPFPAAGADRQLSAAFRTRENRMGKNRDE
jgi:hypothetical protein